MRYKLKGRKIFSRKKEWERGGEGESERQSERRREGERERGKEGEKERGKERDGVRENIKTMFITKERKLKNVFQLKNQKWLRDGH